MDEPARRQGDRQVLGFDAEPGSDVYAVLHEQHISVTPLDLDLTCQSALETLAALQGKKIG